MLSQKGIDIKDREIYTLRCLSTETGLYALGSGLLSYDDAKRYAKNETLEYFLENPELPYFRLYKPYELDALKKYQLHEIRGDYAFIALEEKLITNEQLAKVTRNEQYSLSKIFTYYGVIALREKLISFEDALILGGKIICAAVLEELFTANGIAALREGLYTREQILAVSGQTELKEMLQPNVLEMKRKEKEVAREYKHAHAITNL